MLIKDRILEIQKLSEFETPFEVARLFGELQIYGDQIGLKPSCDLDLATTEEFQVAITWLVEQLGGKVKWAK